MSQRALAAHLTPTCNTLLSFPYRLLLGQSVGEFLKLSDDGAVSLGPGQDVSLLIIVQELGDASVGAPC